MNIQVIPRLLSSAECEELLIWGDQEGPWNRLRTKWRKEFSNESLRIALWSRIQSSVSDIKDSVGDRWNPIGLNCHFRLVRYDAGDRLSLHEDGFHMPAADIRSFASVTIYLNTVSDGGATFFPDHGVSVQPHVGNGLILWIDDILHEGLPVPDGQQKFILRTDIMFQRVPGTPRREQLRSDIFAARQLAEVAEEKSEDCGVNAWMHVCNLEAELKRSVVKEPTAEVPAIDLKQCIRLPDSK